MCESKAFSHLNSVSKMRKRFNLLSPSFTFFIVIFPLPQPHITFNELCLHQRFSFLSVEFHRDKRWRRFNSNVTVHSNVKLKIRKYIKVGLHITVKCRGSAKVYELLKSLSPINFARVYSFASALTIKILMVTTKYQFS